MGALRARIQFGAIARWPLRPTFVCSAAKPHRRRDVKRALRLEEGAALPRRQLRVVQKAHPLDRLRWTRARSSPVRSSRPKCSHFGRSERRELEALHLLELAQAAQRLDLDLAYALAGQAEAAAD